MKNALIAVIFALFTSNAFAAEFFALNRIILNHVDDIPNDTATNGTHPRGMLSIENGRVNLFVQICARDGVTCGEIITLFQNTAILSANQNVALMADGTEVNILQLSPQLIISLHVPYVATDIFFFEPTQ